MCSFHYSAALLAAAIATAVGTTHAAEQSVRKVQIVAEKVCCNGCAQKVAAELYTAPGVTNVEADITTHTLTVSLKPSSKVTLAQLWAAVERGDGKPSKLITSDAAYILKHPDELQLTEPLALNRFWLVVRSQPTNEVTQKIVNQLRAIRGVEAVRFNLADRTFFVEAASDKSLSPWNLISAVESAGIRTESITGPHGFLKIEPLTSQAGRAAVNPTPSEGVVR